MGRKRPRLLVVNDDGINGAGLRPLIDALSTIGEVTTLVPDQERSAQSHTLTLHKPMRLTKVRNRLYKLNGTPADCARLGALRLMKGHVDLIVSGINRGYNLGQDTVYSGTVAAAMEGILLKFPAFAISSGYRKENIDFARAAAFARRLSLQILSRGLPPGTLLNINVPPKANPSAKLKGPRITFLGERVYDNRITVRRDPLGAEYIWLVGRSIRSIARTGTDVAATKAGRISITPLQADNTNRPFMSRLRTWDL